MTTVSIATRHHDFGVVPVGQADYISQEIADGLDETVFIRNPVTDEIISKIAPKKPFWKRA
jgi:hypothetical protein